MILHRNGMEYGSVDFSLSHRGITWSRRDTISHHRRLSIVVNAVPLSQSLWLPFRREKAEIKRSSD